MTVYDKTLSNEKSIVFCILNRCVIYSQSYNGSQSNITTSMQVSILYMTGCYKNGVYDDLF